MADDEQGTSGMVSGLVQDFIAQLRAVTEGLEDLAGSAARRPLAPGAFPLPGALSAAQLTSIAGSVGAQRRSIEALKAQLSSFDEQLSVLEQILAPLAEWSRTWAELEEQLLNVRRKPAAGNQASSSLPDSSPRPRHLPSVRRRHRQLTTTQAPVRRTHTPDLRHERAFGGAFAGLLAQQRATMCRWRSVSAC
jgi:hypothetical protein